MAEFELIKKFFVRATPLRQDVVLGIGDDCAVVTLPPKNQLAITTDTLVSGVHFPLDALAYDIGYKALAVNLSDLAAMGAMPAWITLSLTLPNVDENWLSEFSRGLFELADRYQIQLIGGNMARGPLAVTIAAHGFLPEGKLLKRSGAKVDNLVYVTNTLGDAGLALQFLNRKIAVKHIFQKNILEKFYHPEARIVIGEKIRDVASAAIDISDGLAADLNHLLEASSVGAVIQVDRLPLSEALKTSVSTEVALDFALNAGEDYELCFTVAPEHAKIIESIAKETHCTITCIGKITAGRTLDLQFENGKKYDGKIAGYQHF